MKQTESVAIVMHKDSVRCCMVRKDRSYTSRLSELEAYGVSVYFAHPYSSSERPQNERHNRIFRRVLGYRTPEDLFDEFLDQVYSIDKVRVA